MVALALGDAEASAWIEGAQASRGSVGIAAGQVFRDVTALAVLAMRSPTSISSALAWLVGARGRSEPQSVFVPHDPNTRGWSWTTDTYGWTEPTAWGVLALRSLAEVGDAVADGISLLRDRECAGGGWNYGNRVVLEEALPPFVQTTALALIALQGLDEPMAARGLAWLARAWESEAEGLLSVAAAATTLRSYAAPEATAAATALRRRLEGVTDPDTVALAWAAIALGDGLERLVIP